MEDQETLAYLFLGVAVILLLVTVLSLIYFVKMSRMHQRITQMIDAAIRGEFEEEVYDESIESAIESKLKAWIGQAISNANELERERNVIKGTIADISHQTKTPIANLKIYTELLKELNVEGPAGEYVDMIQSQTEKLNFLIQALVKASRLETGVVAVQPVRREIKDLFEEVMQQENQIAAEHGMKLLVQYEATAIQYDLKWTMEAFMNLVDNAIKYSNGATVIEIQGSAYELFYRIDIKDHGIGISEEDQSKIFARFYRASEVNQKAGVGLGLYLARKIIMMQGGYLKVSSHLGEGSTFSLFLKR